MATTAMVAATANNEGHRQQRRGPMEAGVLPGVPDAQRDRSSATTAPARPTPRGNRIGGESPTMVSSANRSESAIVESACQSMGGACVGQFIGASR